MAQKGVSILCVDIYYTTALALLHLGFKNYLSWGLPEPRGSSAALLTPVHQMLAAGPTPNPFPCQYDYLNFLQALPNIPWEYNCPWLRTSASRRTLKYRHLTAKPAAPAQASGPGDQLEYILASGG